MAILDKTDDELLAIVAKEAPASVMYQQSRDILQFRSTKQLVEQTQRLAKQTKKLASWTIGVAIGTGILAVATWALVWVSKK